MPPDPRLLMTLRPASRPGAALFALSDDFSQGSTLTGRGWTIEDASPSASPSDLITSGYADITVAGGGATGSFWFDANDGCLWYKTVTGPFDMRARVQVLNAAGSGLPETANFHIAGIAAHDPNRANMNYVHVGLGSNDASPLKEEWKTTDNSVSTFAYTNATLTGGQLLYDLRLVRRASDDQIFDAMVRAGNTEPLTSDVGWTTIQSMDRSDNTAPARASAVPLPSTVRCGPMLYSNVATHDIRLRVFDIRYGPTFL